VFAIAFSIWVGGKDRRALDAMNSQGVNQEAWVTQLEQAVEEKPESSLLKYNLANLYHHQKKYQDAQNLLQEVLNSKDLDQKLAENSLFNLGNNLYRQAEKEKELQKSLPLLRESLVYYKDLLDRQQREERFSSKKTENPTDQQLNYILVRQRIKILMDLLKQQKKEATQQKNIYQLLIEVKKKEEEIRQELQTLAQQGSSQQREQLRNRLLTKRRENRETIQVLRKKILEQMQTPVAPPKAKGLSPNKLI